MTSDPFINPLIIALDVDSESAAMELIEKTHDITGGYKLGPRLVLRYGKELVKKISYQAPVFLDFKFFDIPSTMVASVKAAFDLGASAVSVHGLAGREALVELAKLQRELRSQRPFRIMGISILTSWNEESLTGNFKSLSIEEHVGQLAQVTQESGLDSMVCSPKELEILEGKGFYLMTPGIRASAHALGDQKRVLGPREAVELGANAIVVGRPIYESPNPREVAMDFLTQIYHH